MIVVVRPGASVGFAVGLAVAVAASSVDAEPRFEASGFVGIGYFAGDNELGNSWAPEQVPNTAPVIGARLGYVVAPALAHVGTFDLQLAVEAELALATAFTGSEPSRMSYFAPVFGWRAHAALRLAGASRIRPHVVIGAGGETVASSSPFMAKETDPVVYWGGGAAVRISDRWLVRGDVRYGLMPSRGDGVSSTLEVQVGLATSFGLAARDVRRVAPDPEHEPLVVVEDHDGDGDGIPDRRDACPAAAENVNGIDDGDGCPEVDPDGDGLLGVADHCPDAPEDFDHFEDADGCPELDNDSDGVDDARDACPMEPETRNGIDDTDGCADVVPDDVTRALASAGTLGFERGRARVTPAGKLLLRSLLAVLAARPDIRIAVVAHPPEGAKNPGTEDLAKRRGEAVKWYLVDQGVIEDRIETTVGPVGKPVKPIELTLKVR